MKLIDIHDHRRFVLEFTTDELLFLKWALDDYCIKLEARSQDEKRSDRYQFAEWLAAIKPILRDFEGWVK
jgi:hypothetical protein